MFEELAALEAIIALSGFVMTLRHFKGAMRFLSLILLCDALSNIFYIFFLENEIVFMANALTICVLVNLFGRHIKRRKRLL